MNTFKYFNLQYLTQPLLFPGIAIHRILLLKAILSCIEIKYSILCRTFQIQF